MLDQEIALLLEIEDIKWKQMAKELVSDGGQEHKVFSCLRFSKKKELDQTAYSGKQPSNYFPCCY